MSRNEGDDPDMLKQSARGYVPDPDEGWMRTTRKLRRRALTRRVASAVVGLALFGGVVGAFLLATAGGKQSPAAAVSTSPIPSPSASRYRCLSSDRDGYISCDQAIAVATREAPGHYGTATATFLAGMTASNPATWVVVLSDVTSWFTGPAMGTGFCVTGPYSITIDAQSGTVIAQGTSSALIAAQPTPSAPASPC